MSPLFQDVWRRGPAGHAAAYREKLLAMGLTRETAFTAERIAPMGDPLEIQL